MLAAFVLAVALFASAQPTPHVAELQVHGNTLTSDAEVLELAGVHFGMRVEATTADEVAARLRASHKFQHVDVLERFASIADPSQVALVIVVDEGPVRILENGSVAPADAAVGSARVERVRGLRLMFLPILDVEDGYGFAYGVRLALPEPFGAGSRVSFPVTWGGVKRAGIQFDHELSRVPITRIQAGAELERRENPFFNEDDDRRRVWMRGERDLGRSLRLGATVGWERVSFLDARDRFLRTGVDLVFDTRIDPMLARNAIYARAAWDRLAFGAFADANRTDLEARGYLGLLGQSVLVVRALRQDSSRSLPSYLSPLLGGSANLRGFRAGSAIGDTLVASSVELRLPLTSPLSVGKLGVSAFADVAQVYDKGERQRDQRVEHGLGGGVWFSAAFVRLNLCVARGVGRSTRVHFGTTVLF